MKWLKILSIMTLMLMLTAAASAAEKIVPLKIGQTAPDFRLQNVDDKYYTLKNFAKKDILVVLFTANHCPTAQAYEDRFSKIVKDYKNKSVAFVAISPNDPLSLRPNELGYTDVSDTFADNKIRAKQKEFKFPYLYDGDSQAISKKYGPRATPHIFIFDKERKLQYEGGIDDSERIKNVKANHARNALDALLAGKAIPKPTTPTFGCSIKWAGKRNSVKAWNEKADQEEVTLKPIDVKGVSELLANKTDKLLLINLWASWCPPCRAEFPELVALNRQYRSRPFEMVLLSADDYNDEGKKAALDFLKKNHASTTNYIFSDTDKNNLVKALEGTWKGAIPFTLLVKPGGEIIFTKTGMIEDSLEIKGKIVDMLGRTY